MDYERSRNAPPEDVPQLSDIPGVRYTDPEFLQLERERMWQRAWLYAGHVDQIPNPSSWFLTRHTGSPILVVRVLEGQVSAFYNTYQHPGTPMVRVLDRPSVLVATSVDLRG